MTHVSRTELESDPIGTWRWLWRAGTVALRWYDHPCDAVHDPVAVDGRDWPKAWAVFGPWGVDEVGHWDVRESERITPERAVAELARLSPAGPIAVRAAQAVSPVSSPHPTGSEPSAAAPEPSNAALPMNAETPEPPDGYQPGCSNRYCPCWQPGAVCGEFMGLTEDRYCPQCGWLWELHPAEPQPSLPEIFSVREIAGLNNITSSQVHDVLDQAFQQGPVQVDYQ